MKKSTTQTNMSASSNGFPDSTATPLLARKEQWEVLLTALTLKIRRVYLFVHDVMIIYTQFPTKTHFVSFFQPSFVEGSDRDSTQPT